MRRKRRSQMTPVRSRFIDVRGLRYHLREWGAGADAARTLVMLHGWMDVSASFQFVVDALDRDWCVVAPDWRGFGLSARAPARLLLVSRTTWPTSNASSMTSSGAGRRWLVGHSMGGNVALMYAGVRPQRVRAVVNLEGFGLRADAPGAGAGTLRAVDRTN